MSDAARPPRDELAAFLRKHARDGADIEHYLTLIDEALARFDRPLPANADIARKALRLADTAAKFARELESACAIDLGGDIAREGADSVWPFLRIVQTLGPDGFEDDVASALRYAAKSLPARRFDNAAGQAPALLFRVRAVERQARSASKIFSPRGTPPMVPRERLGVELRGIWKVLSGKNAAARSSQSTIDAPRGDFSRFVKLAIETAAWNAPKRTAVFNAIVGGKTRQK